MNFRLSYFFAVFLAGLLTLGCGSDPDPDPKPGSKPELSILVQRSGESPFLEGLFVGGQDIMLTASVSHTGGPGSEATQLQFYRSEDAAISTDDSPEGERQPVEALVSGASDDASVTVTLPSEVGSYYYGACITLADSQEICSPGLEIIVSELTTITPVSMTESSLPAGGSGYFRFTLESTQGTAIYTSGETNTTGRLYDGDGALVATNFNSGESGNFRLDRPLVSGTYFIRVSGNDLSTAGGYTLHLEESDVTTVEPVSMTDHMLAAGGSDYFQFTLESTQFLVIYSSGATFTTGRLYDRRGVPLATDFYRGGYGNFRINRLLAPGTYFLRVHGAFPSVAGNYTLHVEGGDITTVEPGSMTESMLVSRSRNYFQLTLESAQRLAIHTSGSTNLAGDLYDADGVLLATEDKNIPPNFRIDARIFPAGTYFLRVRGGFFSTSGNYTLHVEEGDTTVMPGSMTSGMLVAGGSSYFRFTLESTQFLSIYTSGGTNVTGDLYDGRGMLLITDENSGEGDNFRIDHPLFPGTYFIRVSGADTSTAGAYTLNLDGVSVTTLTVNPATAPTYILAAGGSHYFQFTLESPRVLSIYTSGMTNTTGRLYDDRGTLLATDFSSGDSDNFRLDRPLAPGTYLIEVKGATPMVAGDYTLHIEGASVTTTMVNPETPPSHTLAAGGNDYFQFTLESTHSLTIYTGGRVDTTGILYNDRGMLLAMDESSGDMSNFRIEHPLDPGIYFIRVSGANRGTAGDYTLHVEAGSAAITVTPGSMTGSTLAAGDSNYFHFTLESPQRLAIHTSGMTNTTGRLFDRHGVLLTTDENSGDGDNFRINRLLAPGAYFVEVKGADMSVMGSYTLNVTAIIDTITTLAVPSMEGETETSNQSHNTRYFWLPIETIRTLTIWSERDPEFGNAGEFRITLYGADHNILVNPGDAIDASYFRTSREFAPGVYLLQVSATNSPKPYILHIRWEADDG